MKFHILYTVNRKFYDEEREFETFAKCEEWLESIGASRWEIGILDVK